jgi:hypothetical protein
MSETTATPSFAMSRAIDAHIPFLATREGPNQSGKVKHCRPRDSDERNSKPEYARQDYIGQEHQKSEDSQEIRPLQHFPSAHDEVPVDEAKQDQSQAMTEMEADPGVPYRGLARDAHRGSLHGCLQLLLGRIELVRKSRVGQMYAAEK